MKILTQKKDLKIIKEKPIFNKKLLEVLLEPAKIKIQQIKEKIIAKIELYITSLPNCDPIKSDFNILIFNILIFSFL